MPLVEFGKMQGINKHTMDCYCAVAPFGPDKVLNFDSPTCLACDFFCSSVWIQW